MAWPSISLEKKMGSPVVEVEFRLACIAGISSVPGDEFWFVAGGTEDGSVFACGQQESPGVILWKFKSIEEFSGCQPGKEPRDVG